jgi:cysteine synthase A
MVIASSILGRIGKTALVQLQHVRPSNGGRILVKLESENATGSMKDRMALAIINAAEADGRLKRGGSVVEYTGGSTGVSLALVCAVKGYSLDIVTSDAFAREKLSHMEALGARLHIIMSEAGRMTDKLTRDMIAAAGEIAKHNGGFWVDQMNNRDQLAAYHEMADEIVLDTNGQIDAFVQSVGTGASLRGIAERLRTSNKAMQIIAVEPAESAVLSGGPSGAHKIDGIGAGYVVPLWQKGVADSIERVSTEEARNMAQRLARQEGLFGGTSTGANLVAALRVADGLPSGGTVVTVMCDTGMKYLSKG